MNKRWGMAIAGVALIAGVVFLAFQPLGAADQWASVGSFVLAAVSLVLSLRARPEQARSEQARPEQARPEQVPPEQARQETQISNVAYAQRGHGPRYESDKHVKVPPRGAPHPPTNAANVIQDVGVYQEGDNCSIRIGQADS